MAEMLGVLGYVPGRELASATYASRHTEPVIPVADVIVKSTTNGRGFFAESGVGFGSGRWEGIEDSLALSSALGVMEANDRNTQGTFDVGYAEEVLLELKRAEMIRGNVDTWSKDHSNLLYPLDTIIELATTDCRGFEAVGRVRRSNIEDSLAVQERLGWMTVNRSAVVYASTIREWSYLNLVAKMTPFNMDTTPVEERGRILIVSSGDPEELLKNVVRGNINAHFGNVEHDGEVLPMTWQGPYAARNLPTIAAYVQQELPEDQFMAHRAELLRTQ